MSRWDHVQRLPFESLAQLISGDVGRLSHRLRVTTKEIGRAREKGLTVWKADAWATRAGFHPVQVWGFDWQRAIDTELADLYAAFDRRDAAGSPGAALADRDHSGGISHS